MTRELLPDDIRRFILTSVPSVPYLEAMLLMRRESATEWTASTLARRLYLGEKKAAEVLTQLREGGFANGDPAQGTMRFAPRDPSLAAIVERIAHWYARDLVGVTRLIHSRIDRSAQQFADAFKLRKDS
jgi:hypothetical protein